MGLIKYLPEAGAGGMTLGALFYMLGGAADALGVPGVSAAVAAGFGFLAGVTYGISKAMKEQ